MSASELHVAYQPDDDGTGKIIATVKSGEFSARGAAWFDPIDVKRTFVAVLRSFPLTATTPALIEGGLVQGEQTVGQIGVVFEDPLPRRTTVLPRSAEPAIVTAKTGKDRFRGIGGRRAIAVRLGSGREQPRRIGQRTDRQPVPRRERLLVPRWLGPLGTPRQLPSGRSRNAQLK